MDILAGLAGQWGNPDMDDPIQDHKEIAGSKPAAGNNEIKIIRFPVKRAREVTADTIDEHKPQEAWLIFRMDIYISEKAADVIVLMDIGSGYVFGHMIVLNEIPLQPEAEKLLSDAHKTQNCWPEILYCSRNDPARELFKRIAGEKGIHFETAPAQLFYKLTAPIIAAFRNFPVSKGGEMEDGQWDEATEEELEALSLLPDTYDPCPCASGKKFKFCCKPVYAEIIEAMALAEEGRTKQALESMENAKQKAGETPEILCRYAIVYSFSDKKKCNEYRDRCLELNPNHPRANYILGIDLKGQEKYEEALKAYQKAAENYPSGDRFHLNEVWNNIGSVYYELADYQKAREVWMKALSYMPSDRMARDNLKLLDEAENELPGDDLELLKNIDEALAAKPSGLNPELKELLKDKDFSSLEEMNAFLTEYSMKKNRTPREEFGGLSPEMMAALLCEPIDSPGSPLKFSEKIDEGMLNKSLLFRDAKNFLKLFDELSPVKMTVSKKLNRKFVGRALDVSEYKKEQERWLYEKKAMNEQDFWWLHIMRIIFEIAGLIRKRKGSFHITKTGKQYLSQPGPALYGLLFKTFFYEFNLDYTVHFGPDIPQIQNTANFSLFMARNYCAEWTKPEEFSKKVVIDGLRMHKNVKWEYEYLTLEDALEARFIRPMIDFGLFETKKINKSDSVGLDKYLIRTAPLLKKFIDFNFKKDNNC